MMYLKDLVKKNNHKIVKYNECKAGKRYISVFDYSIQHGGTYDGFKYYNESRKCITNCSMKHLKDTMTSRQEPIEK